MHVRRMRLLMAAIVIRGDAAHLPLPDASVDLVMTSPPYFALRSYADGGEHYDGQIGSEATPHEYLEALWACTAEWVRVLKPGGSVFVNLGDKYSGAQAQNHDDGNRRSSDSAEFWKRTDPKRTGIPNKSLMGLPWRYALGCMDQLGLILRAEIIWAKPNGLPESVTDRVRRSHEQVFHFTRLPRYYSAVDEIRVPHQPQSVARTHRNRFAPHQPQSVARTHRNRFAPHQPQSGVGSPNTLNPADACNPLGKLPGSVWEIPSAPLVVPAHLGVDHFAAYPPELCRRIILGWSPPGICTACGEGRRPLTTYTGERGRHPAGGGTYRAMKAPGAKDTNLADAALRPRLITGYSCACPDATAPARPALVVDPFGRTGTTALVASAYGRLGITIDRSADYCRLARWRTRDPGERARALNVPKPPPVPDGQQSLFDEETA